MPGAPAGSSDTGWKSACQLLAHAMQPAEKRARWSARHVKSLRNSFGVRPVFLRKATLNALG